jgi:hypothetical protein
MSASFLFQSGGTDRPSINTMHSLKRFSRYEYFQRKQQKTAYHCITYYFLLCQKNDNLNRVSTKLKNTTFCI